MKTWAQFSEDEVDEVWDAFKTGANGIDMGTAREVFEMKFGRAVTKMEEVINRGLDYNSD